MGHIRDTSQRILFFLVAEIAILLQRFNAVGTLQNLTVVVVGCGSQRVTPPYQMKGQVNSDSRLFYSPYRAMPL